MKVPSYCDLYRVRDGNTQNCMANDRKEMIAGEVLVPLRSKLLSSCKYWRGMLCRVIQVIHASSDTVGKSSQSSSDGGSVRRGRGRAGGQFRRSGGRRRSGRVWRERAGARGGACG